MTVQGSQSPDGTLLGLRHAQRRMPHRINQTTARTPLSTSVNTPAMIFTWVARLETSTRPCDRSGQVHDITAMQPFSNKSRLAIRIGIAMSA
jgi:hypothetical protein